MTDHDQHARLCADLNETTKQVELRLRRFRKLLASESLPANRATFAREVARLEDWQRQTIAEMERVTSATSLSA